MPAPVAATVVTAPQTAGEPVDVAAGFEAEDDLEAQAVELGASQIANAAPMPSTAPGAPAANIATAIATSAPVPTPDQLAHLCTIRERLSAKERAIAENAMARMEPAMLAHWLTELSAMSAEDHDPHDGRAARLTSRQRPPLIKPASLRFQENERDRSPYE
jgi:hypothetical protein